MEKLKTHKSILNRLKSSRGFSIIETILTTTLLAFALFGGMTVMQNATANTVNADLGTIATQLANEKVEMILAEKAFNGYDSLTTGEYDSEANIGNYSMTRTTQITEVNADDLETEEAESGVKMVEVSVGWGSQAYQSVTVSTLITDFE